MNTTKKLLLVLSAFSALNAQAITVSQLNQMMTGSTSGTTNDYLAKCTNQALCVSGTTSVYNMYHPGIDYSASSGTQVATPVSGVVVKTANTTEPQADGFGTIVIKDTSGKYLIFGHMSSSRVRSGDKVQRGCLIGFSGSKGTNNAHLHVEYRSTNPNMANYFSSTAAATSAGNLNPTSAVSTYVALSSSLACKTV